MFILSYHGITNTEGFIDDFEARFQKHLALPVFEKQMHAVKNHYTPLTLTQFLEKYQSRSLKDSDILISFDDGYKNVNNALPILQNFEIPAVFSVTPQRIGAERFWADDVEKAIRFTSKGDITFRGEKYDVSTKEAKTQSLIQIKALFKTFPISVNKQEVENLLQECGIDSDQYHLDKQDILAWDEIRKISNHPFFDIVHHGNTHYPLARFESAEEIEEEIHSCITTLSQELGISPVVFVYPFGEADHHDERVISVLKKYGFQQGWTVQNKPVDYENPFEIYRLEPKKDIFDRYIANIGAVL